VLFHNSLSHELLLHCCERVVAVVGMPHMIFQTKFPMYEEMAEISFFGSIERETMESLQQCTLTALQSATPKQAQPVVFWRPSPYSGHVV
jgi:hypothetical protein